MRLFVLETQKLNLTAQEFRTLRDVSIRGLEDGTVSRAEAQTLLRIAQRARPKAGRVADILKELDSGDGSIQPGPSHQP